jgi:integrase
VRYTFGEAPCRLQWGDVDLDAQTLRVERSLEEPKVGLRLKPPKTKRGRRNIKLLARAVAMLRGHKLEQMQLRLALGMGKIESTTLIFGTIGESRQHTKGQT